MMTDNHNHFLHHLFQAAKEAPDGIVLNRTMPVVAIARTHVFYADSFFDACVKIFDNIQKNLAVKNHLKYPYV